VPQEDRDTGSALDAEDISILRNSPRRSGNKKKSARMPPIDKPATDQTVLDGLTRSEVDYLPICLKRRMTATEGFKELLEDKNVMLNAYIVGGRDVLRSWERSPTVIVFVPDELGWRDTGNRILADEIAFANQAIVVLPDVHRGVSWASSTTPSNYSSSSDFQKWRETLVPSRVFDDIVAILRYCKQIYGDTCNLGIAGVGLGAGSALELVADFDQVKDHWQRTYAPDEQPPAKRKGFELKRPVQASPDPGMLADPSAILQKELQTEEMQKALDELLASMDEVPSDWLRKKPLIESTVSARVAVDVKDSVTDVRDNPLIPYTEDDEEHREDALPSIADWEMQLLLSFMPPNDTSSSQMKSTNQVDKKSKKSVEKDFSLTLEELVHLRPRAVLALCPCYFDVRRVGKWLSTSTCLVFGEKDDQPGTRSEDFALLTKILSRKGDKLTDFCLRVYEGRRAGFMKSGTEEDERCAQDALGIGSVWLDIYCRERIDATEGFGEVKSSNPAVFIPLSGLRGALRTSGVAKYLHDDPNFVRNERLDRQNSRK